MVSSSIALYGLRVPSTSDPRDFVGLAPTNRTRATAPSPPGPPKRAREDPPCEVIQVALDGEGGVIVGGRRLRVTPERLRSLGIPSEAPKVRRVAGRNNVAATRRKPRRGP
jgi:hypothetical protein